VKVRTLSSLRPTTCVADIAAGPAAAIVRGVVSGNCGRKTSAKRANGELETGDGAPCMLFPSMSKLSHFDDAGEARMVDVSAKAVTRREAEASAFVALNADTLAALPNNPKGNPLEVARIAGIQAAKRTAELIPMCHPLPLSFVDVRTEVVAEGIAIRATAATTAGTGVEMEAMTAAAVAALTVYDMCKALDKDIVIRDLRLERKTGGKSGEYTRASQR
jgi:cyclic pyranopterin phosphate synthase